MATPKIRKGVPAPAIAPRLGDALDERRGVEYREFRSASLVNRFIGRPLPFGWTANPYRGCEMGCRYCYARYTHEFLGRNDPEDFERRGFKTYGMFYASHYSCNEFGIPDPNTDPFTVIVRSVTEQLRHLRKNGVSPTVRVTAWIQGFDYPNIYGCGLDGNGKGIKGKKGIRTAYVSDPENFRRQIQALKTIISSIEFKDMLLTESWIVWHPAADYRKENFEPKSKER